MNMFANLKTDDSIQNETDSVGSSGPLDSNIYKATVNMAYAITSKGGAQGIVLTLKTETGRELRQTLWISSGKEKGCLNYYETKDGDRKYLPGFLLFQSISLLTKGVEITDLDIQEKVVNIYNVEAKKEVPTSVPVIMDLLDQEVYTAVIKQTVDKNVKNPNFDESKPSHKTDNPMYIANGETRDENEIDKFFRASDKMTTAEIRAGAEEAVFFDTWLGKWEGQTKDKTSKDAPKANTGTAGNTAPQTAAPKTSLFKRPA
jgi:hypothetical protein